MGSEMCIRDSIHTSQKEESQYRCIVLGQISGAGASDDKGTEAGNGHGDGQNSDHGKKFSHNNAPYGYRGGEKQLVCPRPVFIRYAAHGQNRHRNHKYHQDGIKCIGKIGVTVNHIVNHEINAHEHGHESNENIACHGAEIGFQLPLIDSSHWESLSLIHI